MMIMCCGHGVIYDILRFVPGILRLNVRDQQVLIVGRTYILYRKEPLLSESTAFHH